MSDDTIKRQYARLAGLPASQMRFSGELTPAQIEEVRWHFTANLAGFHNYVYAVKQDGGLVWNRWRRDPLMEMRGDYESWAHE